jgi:alkylated DNA repair dioxygenase AlkB
MIPGLFYIKNLPLSDTLLSYIDSREWVPLSDSPGSRKVQHYGYRYNYKSKSVTDPAEPIPDEFKSLLEHLSDFGQFNQAILNNYEPGQGISAHTDSPLYGDAIACYTLGSGCIMKFTKGDRVEELYVEPNSVYVMTGAARHEWKHEMVSRKSDTIEGKRIKRGRRVSITFRKIKE